MGLFSSLFTKRPTQTPTPRSVWKELDSNYDRLEQQRPSQKQSKRSQGDIWEKLDDFYSQQEQRLGRCAARTAF